MENQPIKVEEQAVLNLASKFDALNRYLQSDITNLFDETKAVISDCKGAYAGQLSSAADVAFTGIYYGFTKDTGVMSVNLQNAAKEMYNLDLKFGQWISGDNQ